MEEAQAGGFDENMEPLVLPTVQFPNTRCQSAKY